MLAFPQRRISLGGELEHIAAVGEDRGAVGQHDGEAGAAGETRQPGEPLRACRHVFAEMLVGARHDEAVEPLRRQFLPQRGQPRRPLALVVRRHVHVHRSLVRLASSLGRF